MSFQSSNNPTKVGWRRPLIFLNLLDRQGNLSITNCMVIAMTIKVLTIPELELTGFAAFFTAVISYKFKGWQEQRKSL